VSRPLASPGQRIGLFGGSFNPAHEAHRSASLYGWKRLGLDRIWWLVSPGNPLKETKGVPSLEARMAGAQQAANSSFIEVTDIEAMLGTRFTYDTVSRLKACHPRVRFVLLMGADILAEFHRWKRWRELASSIPLAVVDRAGWTAQALASPAAQALAPSRIQEYDAVTLASRRPPAWIFLHGLKLEQSSTALRLKSGQSVKG
jgi:nicotinate-nucleotide adenylyltransferase